MELRKQLWGYRRADVHAAMDLQAARVREQEAAAAALADRVAELEAELEAAKVQIAALRRRVANPLGDRSSTDLVLIVGPMESVGELAPLAEAITQCPYLTPRLRLYRDGYYHLECSTEDMTRLLGWLHSHEDIASVSTVEGAVRVVPAQRSVS
jgi:hypothetical protein